MSTREPGLLSNPRTMAGWSSPDHSLRRKSGSQVVEGNYIMYELLIDDDPEPLEDRKFESKSVR